MIILNILWLVCSIPIFTIGASTTAVYYVTLKLARDDDGYTIRSFFKSFKENFKQSTAIWLILLAVGMILGIDMYFFTRLYTGSGSLRTVMVTVFLAMALIYAAVFTYIFPLQARFFNTVKRTFFNAFFMSLRHLFRTIGLIAIDGVLLAAGFVFMIPPVLMIFMLFGFPLLAFINSYILTPVFNQYIPKEEEKREELRPLFTDEEESVSSILMAKGDEHQEEMPENEETEVKETQDGQE
uniref:YesL family protein n=1 Tax=Clostridium sp. NkU-1 TaxID=1095009 RepID=UPI000A61A552